MSRNYELLQQAGFAVQTPTFTVKEQSAATAEYVAAPTSDEFLAALEPTVREETLKLVQRLFLMPQEAGPKAVLFAPIDTRFGCDWLCSVAAKLLAKSVPGSVCLVDGNFRDPSFIDKLGVSCEAGLVGALELNGSIREFTRPIGPDNLFLLSTGATVQDSTILLNSDRLRDRFAELREQFDYVIASAPPLNAFGDGMVLGRMVDGVVLVLEEDATRREAAVRATESLRNASIPILGAVLNNRKFPIPAALYKRV